MKSIYFKNFLMTSVLVFFSFLVLATSFVILGRAFALNEKRDSIAQNAVEAASVAGALSNNGNLTGWYLRLVISSISRSTGNHIMIADVDGTVVSVSDMEAVSPYIGKHINEAVLAEIDKNKRYQQITSLDNIYNERPYYVVGLPIITSGNGRMVGYVFVGSELVESMYLYEFNESKIKDFEQFREHLVNDICGKSAQEVVRYYKIKKLEKLEAELAENGE